MPTLSTTLQHHDLGFLKIVGDAWGVELQAPGAADALPILVREICREDLVSEIVETLPQEAQDALTGIVHAGGRMPWSVFSRKFGDVRAMGAGRRDRERPDLNPVSAAEILWYRCLIGKAFLNLPPEPQEYAYIPDEIIAFLEVEPSEPSRAWGCPAELPEIARVFPASDRILDHACTLLAALRSEAEPLSSLRFTRPTIPSETLKSLLQAAQLLDDHGMPLPEDTKKFLESPRANALAFLSENWIKSARFNELSLLSTLEIEGVWRNDPLLARQFVVDILREIPPATWWDISSLIQTIKKERADFQRPAGDYDSWFIRSKQTGEFLRGFSSWDRVEGELIYYMLTGPLHWLGILDLAAPPGESSPSAFRLSAWAQALLAGSLPQGLKPEKEPLLIQSDASFILKDHTPRAARYIIARFCQWAPSHSGEYRYVLTPDSMGKAAEQGLKAVHLVHALKKYTSGPVPPMLLQAIERWSKVGPQARLTELTLLEVSSPEVLDALKKSSAARYLTRTLSPTLAVVNRGAEEKIRAALAELGYLAQIALSGSDG